MSRIRSRDTKPELMLRKELFRRGYRYRLHGKKLPGKPDLVLNKWNAVIFVHGCFWHRHEGCKYSTIPATRTEFWRGKFDSNVARGAKNIETLLVSGWRVAVIWQCALKRGAEPVVDDLIHWIVKRDNFFHEASGVSEQEQCKH
jgi:DNA mismatch endonuclease (patch repair protein)